MKRKALLLCLVLTLALLAGCAGEERIGEDVDLTLDETLTGLIGESNAKLREAVSGTCYAEITPLGTARLTYFSPYRSFRFALDASGYGTWRPGFSDGLHTENPFNDSLTVMQIELCEVIDPEAPAVEDQSSLQQLFGTQETITYEFLCGALKQRPQLEHNSEVYYDLSLVTGDAAVYHEGMTGRVDRTGVRLFNGEDSAAFLVHGLRLEVGFLPDGDEYLAYHVRIKKA